MGNSKTQGEGRRRQRRIYFNKVLGLVSTRNLDNYGSRDRAGDKGSHRACVYKYWYS